MENDPEGSEEKASNCIILSDFAVLFRRGHKWSDDPQPAGGKETNTRKSRIQEKGKRIYDFKRQSSIQPRELQRL